MYGKRYRIMNEFDCQAQCFTGHLLSGNTLSRRRFWEIIGRSPSQKWIMNELRRGIMERRNRGPDHGSPDHGTLMGRSISLLIQQGMFLHWH